MNSYQTLSAYYDRFTDDVGYGQWADFFEQLFAREDIRPQLVLDLACGTGSLTRLLAKRGYDMIGADASPEMLMQAMQNTMDCSPRPLLINQRMEELDLYGNVDACLCCLDSVNYVTDPDDLAEAFRRVHLFRTACSFLTSIRPRNSPVSTGKAMSARTTACSASGRRQSRTACALISSIFLNRMGTAGRARRKRTRSASTSRSSLSACWKRQALPKSKPMAIRASRP